MAAPLFLEEEVNTESCQWNCQDSSLDEANDDFFELDRRLGCQHNGSSFREEDDLAHGNQTNKCACFVSNELQFALCLQSM